MNEVKTANCHYRQDEHGIHDFALLNPTRQAVDEFFRLRLELEQETTGEFMLLLIRLQMSQLPSITHVMTKVRALSTQHPNIQATYTAIIYRRGMLVFVLNNFLKVFMRSRDRIMFFAEEDVDQAMDWLLKHG